MTKFHPHWSTIIGPAGCIYNHNCSKLLTPLYLVKILLEEIKFACHEEWTDEISRHTSLVCYIQLADWDILGLVGVPD